MDIDELRRRARAMIQEQQRRDAERSRLYWLRARRWLSLGVALGFAIGSVSAGQAVPRALELLRPVIAADFPYGGP